MRRWAVICAVLCSSAAHVCCADGTAVVTSTNGTVRTLPLTAAVQQDGGRRVTVRAADVQDAKWVDILLGCAEARKGESGFWLSQRGLIGLFTRDSGEWSCTRNWVTPPRDNLILVEFGGRPIFYHLGKDNIPGILAAYRQFKTVRHLQLEEMTRHDELSPGASASVTGTASRFTSTARTPPRPQTVSPSRHRISGSFRRRMPNRTR